MKIVVRRHVSDFQVFRALAVAQAAAAAAGPDAEVFLECLQHHSGILKLTPSIRWKNPHHPYEVAARHSKDPNLNRPGGKVFDEVIDIDADGPLEIEFRKSGLSWWRFIVAKATTQTAFGQKLTIPTFPTIEAIAQIPTPAPGFVVVAPLSTISDPRQININSLEDHVKARFPGAPIYWLSPFTTGDCVVYGENRPILHYDDLPELATILRAARAVFAVNGLVSALAQSTFQGKRLVSNYCHIRGSYPKGSKDIFLQLVERSETEIDRDPTEPPCGVISTNFPGDCQVSEIAPLPAD